MTYGAAHATPVGYFDARYRISFELDVTGNSCISSFQAGAVSNDDCIRNYPDLLPGQTYSAGIALGGRFSGTPDAWRFGIGEFRTGRSLRCLQALTELCFRGPYRRIDNNNVSFSFAGPAGTAGAGNTNYLESVNFVEGGRWLLQDDQNSVYQDFRATVSNITVNPIPLPASGAMLGIILLAASAYSGIKKSRRRS